MRACPLGGLDAERTAARIKGPRWSGQSMSPLRMKDGLVARLPVESGQPSAYELRKFGPVEHHAYHSMILVACAIVTNRVPVLAGPSQAEFEGSYQSDSSTGYRRPPSAPMPIWHHHCRGGERRPDVVRGFAVPAHGLVRRANTRRSPTSRVEAPSTSQLDTPLLANGGGGSCHFDPPPTASCATFVTRLRGGIPSIESIEAIQRLR